MGSLTAIVANNKVDIGTKSEGTKEGVAHEVLQGDALQNPCITDHISSTLKRKHVISDTNCQIQLFTVLIQLPVLENYFTTSVMI